MHSTKKVVGMGGLEPPTSRLSVVCSNQLSYMPTIKSIISGWRDSNSRPSGPKPDALAIWATPRHIEDGYIWIEINGAGGQDRTADTRLFRPLLYHWATPAYIIPVQMWVIIYKSDFKNQVFFYFFILSLINL